MSNENKKLGQEPAYPTEVTTNHNGSFSAKQTGNYTYLAPGMSKRFYAACAAMQGIITGMKSAGEFLNIKEVVEASYEYADELLKQEDEQ